jgi:hypothetical protein
VHMIDPRVPKRNHPSRSSWTWLLHTLKMVKKIRPSPASEEELCAFLSYVADLKRDYWDFKNSERIVEHIGVLLTFLERRSKHWTRGEELSYNIINSEIARIVTAPENRKVACLVEDPSVAFGASNQARPLKFSSVKVNLRLSSVKQTRQYRDDEQIGLFIVRL